MDDGTPTPDRHDGMAVVAARGRSGRSELTLIRNHERGPILPGAALPVIGAGQAPVYDDFAAPGVIEGMNRECSMAWPLTKPLLSLSSRRVTTSDASRWS